ncbi:hypothetical protein ACGFWE_39495 [Streptomyces sp. NPDC048523]|uniref:hypothetical protein n=1 Tax=unclassified Streptomyces TaxID=2593676 RepID=UPI00331CF85D
MTELLDAAGASPVEVHALITAIQTGAQEGAHGEVMELDTHAGFALTRGRLPTFSTRTWTGAPRAGDGFAYAYVVQHRR